jgi:hypothetical protein
VHWAPGIPHALLGRKIHAPLGRSAPRECEVAFDENECATLSAVIVRESGRSSIPETLMIESRGRGILDRPVKPDDDSFLRHSPRKRAALVAVGPRQEARPGMTKI